LGGGEVVRQRACRTPRARRASTSLGAGLGIGHGQLARLAVAFCAGALLLPMPVHAGGPALIEVEQAMAGPAKEPEEASAEAFPMEEFLDRLMVAESGGRLRSKNPRSTALGPFQFIESTFLFVVSKHFPSEVAGLTRRQVLARRTNMAFSRRAARAYVHDLMSALASKGLPTSPANVRIAFLVGPSAAIRLLETPPDQPLEAVLSADAIAANPFMSGASIAELVQRAAIEVSAKAATGPPKLEPVVEAAASKREPGATLVVAEAEPSSKAAVLRSEPAGTQIDAKQEPSATNSAEPRSESKCQVGLASCRRWLALQERKALSAQE
jgi:hypothetical protein